jgi:hypothetical protein
MEYIAYSMAHLNRKFHKIFVARTNPNHFLHVQLRFYDFIIPVQEYTDKSFFIFDWDTVGIATIELK